jgi:hypothetical protein
MMRVIDVEGSCYPVPSHGIEVAADVYEYLRERYQLQGVELFAKEAPLARDSAIDGDVADGTVPVAVVPAGDAGAGLKAPLGSAIRGLERFRHLAIHEAAPAAEPPDSDSHYSDAEGAQDAPDREPLDRAADPREPWFRDAGALLAVQRLAPLAAFADQWDSSE